MVRQVVKGVALSLTACVCSALGVNVQVIGARHRSNLISRGGVGLVMLGGLSDFLAYGYAPQSVCAPLGVSSLVFNLIFSSIMHGSDQERVTRLDIFVTAASVNRTCCCHRHRQLEYQVCFRLDVHASEYLHSLF